MEKVRLDTLIFDKGLASSREKARAMILAGEVWVDGKQSDKPGLKVTPGINVSVRSSRMKYVSRGGFKLEGAIKDFHLDMNGKTVLDVGASTGGYTDCALQNQARKVLALDVGYGQLDWSLRNDPRVVVMERTNVRYLTLDELGEKVDLITMDVSFISTTLIFPVLAGLLKEDGAIVSLIKPQFEAGREKVGKNGVVKDPTVHREVLKRCIEAAHSAGLACIGVSYSPLTGPKGNIEYFIYLRPGLEALADIDEKIAAVVREAHHVMEDKSN